MTEEQLATLLETLRWYADRQNYRRTRVSQPTGKYGGGAKYHSAPIKYDKGTRANFVLVTLGLDKP